MKFRLNTPNPVRYLGSLVIAAIVCAILYSVLNAQAITDTVYFLAVGLIAGHLIGILAATPTASSSTDTAGEAVSLYVGNLAYKARNDAIRKHFAQYGIVYSVRIMTDRNTHKPRGYAFVEMDESGAAIAMKKLNDTDFFGRPLRVSTARQQTDD